MRGDLGSRWLGGSLWIPLLGRAASGPPPLSPALGEWSSLFFLLVREPLTDLDLLSFLSLFFLSVSLCLWGVLLLTFLRSSSSFFLGNVLLPSLLVVSTAFFLSSFSLTFLLPASSPGPSAFFLFSSDFSLGAAPPFKEPSPAWEGFLPSMVLLRQILEKAGLCYSRPSPGS